jgi:hypothetical protein
MAEEMDAALAGIDQRHAEIRAYDQNGHAWEAGAGSQIDHTGVCWKMFRRCERIFDV